MSKPSKKRRAPSFRSRLPARPLSKDFDDIIRLIEAAKASTFATLNQELVGLYWQIGEYISRKLESAAWGQKVVQQLAGHIARRHPNLKGFTRSNLLRMRQFYEAYRHDQIVAPLVRQLPWTHNLLILSRSKRSEEREFYLRMALRERWTKRELERQLNGALFERVVLSPAKVSPPVAQFHPDAVSVFKDAYLVEFLDLPALHSEADLQRALVANLRKFLLELGGDFTFVGERFRVQVGGRDFFIDLLFYHRGLSCLVAFDLKVEQFEPEHLGKLEFYLESLDRDVKKPYEGPSIGVLLCATKDEEVVEYALSRAMSPALVAEYQTRLPDKKLLRAKLHEFYELAESRMDETGRVQVSPQVAARLPSTKNKKPLKRRKK